MGGEINAVMFTREERRRTLSGRAVETNNENSQLHNPKNCLRTFQPLIELICLGCIMMEGFS